VNQAGSVDVLCALGEPALTPAKTRTVRCTANPMLLCVKYVVRLDEADCRAHVFSLDACNGRVTEEHSSQPFCGQRIDTFLAKQATEGSATGPFADGTVWTEEVSDELGARKRSVLPDETAKLGLACLELFQFSRHQLNLITNAD
jgi:hypothetical protein